MADIIILLELLALAAFLILLRRPPFR